MRICGWLERMRGRNTEFSLYLVGHSSLKDMRSRTKICAWSLDIQMVRPELRQELHVYGQLAAEEREPRQGFHVLSKGRTYISLLAE